MKYGLVHHLFLPEELIQRELPSDVIPCGVPLREKNDVKAMVSRGTLIECDSVMEFTSPNGKSCVGKEWTIPLTPQAILCNQSLSIDMTVAACKRAQEWGAELVGLGLMLGKIGSRGQTVRKQVNIAITNGDSYLIFNAVQILMRLIAELEVNPMNLQIAVFGFPSTIGTYLTEYLLSLGIGVALIAKQTRYSQKLVERLAGRYRATLTLNSCFSDVTKAVKFIFAAGSGEQFINPAEIDRPITIIDVSFPRNVLPCNRDNLLVIDAGVISLPKDLLIQGYSPNRALSCLVELVLLSFENRKEDFSLGRRLWLRNIHEIGNIAQKHGFIPELLYSFGKPIEKKSLEAFRDILPKKNR